MTLGNMRELGVDAGIGCRRQAGRQGAENTRTALTTATRSVRVTMAIRSIPASSPKDEIQRLPDTTWFGTCAIHIATALREHVLQAFLQRRGREIRKRQRGPQ